MSSPNMNNIILAGAMLAYLSIVFGGASSYVENDTAHIWMCRVWLEIEVQNTAKLHCFNVELLSFFRCSTGLLR